MAWGGVPFAVCFATAAAVDDSLEGHQIGRQWLWHTRRCQLANGICPEMRHLWTVGAKLVDSAAGAVV